MFHNEMGEFLNKEFKATMGNVYTAPEDQVIEFVSTGVDALDLAIGNDLGGGYPVGRIIEIAGMEGTGKSALAAKAIAETQKAGGVGVYFDVEQSFHEGFFQMLGVDTKSWLYLDTLTTIEDIFSAIEKMVLKYREKNTDKVMTIVVDSIMGASTKHEEGEDYDLQGYNTQKARLLSTAMRKITPMLNQQRIILICINQLRVNLGAMYGDKYTTSGGKAIPFHSSVRVFLSKVATLKPKKTAADPQTGIRVRATMKKNRLNAPGRTIDYDFWFTSGVDSAGSMLALAKRYKVVTQAGAWYKFEYVDKVTGEVVEEKFQSKHVDAMIQTNTQFKEAFYSAVTEAYVIEYKPTRSFGIDDIIADVNAEEGDGLDAETHDTYDDSDFVPNPDGSQLKTKKKSDG
jgi:recombination protein RecA